MGLADLLVEECGRLYDNVGGELRCDRCGSTRPLKKPAEDWPVCCRRPMGWWADADVEAGTRRDERSTVGSPRGPRPHARKYDDRTVARVLDLKADGMSNKAIGREVGIPSGSVWTILRREAA